MVQLRRDAVEGLPYTASSIEPPETRALFIEAFTRMKNELVDATGIILNVNVDPPLPDINGEEVREVETVKSEDKPVVAPLVPETDMVQLIGTPMRAGLIFVHVKLLLEVGTPYTISARVPLLIERDVDAIVTLIMKEVVADHTVVENTKEDPPLFPVSVSDPSKEEATKSFATPVVAPLTPEVLIVQTIPVPVLAGLMLIQLKLDAVVGTPYTANE